MLPSFTIHRPAGLAEALTLINDDAVPYWGGTELLLAMNMGLLRPAALVDLKPIAELAGIRVEDERLVLGAGVTHDAVATHPLVHEHAPLLARVEQRVGNARVRTQGTIGGNLCFAEPRSDVATVLIALDASVRLQNATATRTVAVRDFVLGPYWTDRAPDELLVEVSVPRPAPDGVYEKFQTVERPTVAVAITRRGERGVRVVIGAVAEVPVVADYDDLAAVDPAELAGRVEPVADLTGAVDYKRHVTEVHVRRAVAALTEGAR